MRSNYQNAQFMGLLNILGLQKDKKNLQKKTEVVAPNFPEARLERSANYYKHAIKKNAYSPVQQRALDQAKAVQTKEVDLNILNWKEIPGYYEWVMQNAEDLVINLLSEVDVDGQLQVYPGGIVYLDPTGRYFFPSIFFMNAYEYTDMRIPGFIIDASRFDTPGDVQRFLINNVKRRDNLKFINLNIDEYRIGQTIRNPMRELFA